MQFTTEAECVAALAKLRWGDSPECYKCGALNASKARRSRLWNCRDCGHQFSVTRHTFLDGVRMDLSDWFAFIAARGSGVQTSYSVGQIARDLGIFRRSAAVMNERIEGALERGDPLLFDLLGLLSAP